MTPERMKQLREESPTGPVAECLDAVEYWQKDSAAAWDKCEGRRLEGVRLRATNARLEHELADTHQSRYQEGLIAGMESMTNKFYNERAELRATNARLVAAFDAVRQHIYSAHADNKQFLKIGNTRTDISRVERWLDAIEQELGTLTPDALDDLRVIREAMKALAWEAAPLPLDKDPDMTIKQALEHFAQRIRNAQVALAPLKERFGGGE